MEPETWRLWETSDENRLLTLNNESAVNRINIWINSILLLIFLAYQAVMLLEPASPYWINSKFHAYNLFFISICMGYFIVRIVPRINTHKYFIVLTGLCMVGLNVTVFLLLVPFQFTYAEWVRSEELLITWVSPWMEESWRFINFLVFYDIFFKIKRVPNFLKIVSAFLISHTLFYFAHYNHYNVWTFETFGMVWIGFLFIALPLLLIKNYSLVLAAHVINNHLVFIFG
ncbi:MAG: hypothetical protein ACTSRL_03010 [Candidatus Helarchaeota archaeon]